MICQDCKSEYHEGCRGGTWCDCQHRVPLVSLVTGGVHTTEASLEEAALVELTRLMGLE